MMAKWEVIEGKLVREFELETFAEIIEQLQKVNEAANKRNHHPDFCVHGYNKIKFMLSTHDADGITEKDNILARDIDLIFH